MCDQRNTIHFVLEVEKHPCLYNTTLSSYSRKSDTFKAWQEVGAVMNMTGSACKEKWRNLRVVFMRHYRPRPGKKQSRPYYLLDVMQFIKPFITSVSRSANPTEEKETSEISNDTNQSTEESLEQGESGITSVTQEAAEEINERQPSPKKKKFTQRETERQIPSPETDKEYMEYLKKKKKDSLVATDVVVSFLNSLTPELTEMNMQQFKSFKRKVLILVDEITAPSSDYHQPLLSLSSQERSSLLQESYDPLEHSISTTFLQRERERLKTESDEKD